MSATLINLIIQLIAGAVGGNAAGAAIKNEAILHGFFSSGNVLTATRECEERCLTADTRPCDFIQSDFQSIGGGHGFA